MSYTPCSQMQATMLIPEFSHRCSNGPVDLKPIAYTSGSFSDTQQRRHATEKEAFAV